MAKKVLIVLFALSVLFLGFSIGRFTNFVPTSKMSHAAKENKEFKDLDTTQMAIALAVAASSPEIAKMIIDNIKKEENLPREAFSKLVGMSRKVTGGDKSADQKTQARPQAANTAADIFKTDKVEVDVPKGSYSTGSAKAPVTIVTFTEFLCPFCGRLDPIIAELQQEFGEDKVRIVFQSRIVHGERAEYYHLAAAAAGKQGKFFEFSEDLFKTLREWSSTPLEEAFDKVIAPKAKALGLNVAQLKKDMESPEIKAQVAAENALGEKLGVRGTPTSFVNGYMVRGAKPKEFFKEVITELLKKS